MKAKELKQKTGRIHLWVTKTSNLYECRFNCVSCSPGCRNTSLSRACRAGETGDQVMLERLVIVMYACLARGELVD